MRVHNLMEEIVLGIVNEICDEKAEQSPNGYCTSDLCRFDVACYVLNRIPPKYVTSGRGLAHVDKAVKDNQLIADVTALANEGLQRVSDFQRSYYDGKDQKQYEGSGPYYNFPTIKGRVFYGDTFEPVTEVEITLLVNDETVEMLDGRWQNPYHISTGAPGTFTFWPAPLQAGNREGTQSFQFHLNIPETHYDSLDHYFEITCQPEEHAVDAVELTKTLTIEDLYLFPKV